MNMKNQKVIYKYFLHFEKEESWLEKMALEGWRLADVSVWGRYRFVNIDPQTLTYKIDFHKFRDKKIMEDYLALFEDGGWSCAAANVGGYNFYFYTPSGDAPKDIFSDEDSQIQRHQRYSNYIGGSLIASFLPMMVTFIIGWVNFPEKGYLTPGLWQMQGWQLVRHVLFETPFVLFRSGSIWFPPLFLLGGIYLYARYNGSLEKNLKKG
jgi:hypothetical protein